MKTTAPIVILFSFVIFVALLMPEVVASSTETPEISIVSNIEDDLTHPQPMGYCPGPELRCSFGCEQTQTVCCPVCREWWPDGRCKRFGQICEEHCVRCSPKEPREPGGKD